MFQERVPGGRLRQQGARGQLRPAAECGRRRGHTQVAVDEEPFLNRHLFRCLRPRLATTPANHHQEREAWAFDLHSWRAGCSKNIQVCRYSTNVRSLAPFLGHATGNRLEFYRVVEAGETSRIPDMPTRAARAMSLWA